MSNSIWDRIPFDSRNLDLCILTGGFLKEAAERMSLTPEKFVKNFSTKILYNASSSCFRTAFLNRQHIDFAEILLKEGFSVRVKDRAERFMELFVLNDYHIRGARSLLISVVDSDPETLLYFLPQATAHIVTTQPRPTSLPSNCKSWLCFEKITQTASSEQLLPFLSSSDRSSGSLETPSLATLPAISPMISPTRSLAVSSPQGARPQEVWSFEKIVSRIKEYEKEVSLRKSSIKKGNFMQKCSEIPLIDRLATMGDVKIVSDCYEQARTCFQRLAALAPDLANFEVGELESTLAASLASAGASSLCVLFSLHESKCKTEYPDLAFVEGVRGALRTLAAQINQTIEHASLKSKMDPSILKKNSKTIQSLLKEETPLMLWETIEKELQQARSKKSARAWQKIVVFSSELVAKFGVSPQSEKWRSIFGPFLDRIPEGLEMTPEFEAIIQGVELAEDEEEERYAGEMDALGGDTLDANIEVVRKAFRGTKFVFVGGIPYDHTRARIEKAFGVELIWDACEHSANLEKYQNHINNPEVSLFLIKKTLCSHKHNQELVRQIHAGGKRCVRLSHQTNPRAIAVRIVEQCLCGSKPLSGG
ncbi:MAG: hypothetical protein Q4D38_04715 [Planctomycetia bacterium]|nr:hypothetical protein [Planctomycetia bacterium]